GLPRHHAGRGVAGRVVGAALGRTVEHLGRRSGVLCRERGGAGLAAAVQWGAVAGGDPAPAPATPDSRRRRSGPTAAPGAGPGRLTTAYASLACGVAQMSLL